MLRKLRKRRWTGRVLGKAEPFFETTNRWARRIAANIAKLAELLRKAKN